MATNQNQRFGQIPYFVGAVLKENFYKHFVKITTGTQKQMPIFTIFHFQTSMKNLSCHNNKSRYATVRLMS